MKIELTKKKNTELLLNLLKFTYLFLSNKCLLSTCMFMCWLAYVLNGVNKLGLLGHLDCFNLMAIVNNAAINIHVHILFEHLLLFLFSMYPGVEMLDHIVILC